MISNVTPHQLSWLNCAPLAITLIVSIQCANITMGAHKYVEELAKRKQSVSHRTRRRWNRLTKRQDVMRFLLRVRCWEVWYPLYHAFHRTRGGLCFVSLLIPHLHSMNPAKAAITASTIGGMPSCLEAVSSGQGPSSWIQSETGIRYLSHSC